MLGPGFLETRPDEYHTAGSTGSGGAEVRLEETLRGTRRLQRCERCRASRRAGRLGAASCTPRAVDLRQRLKSLEGEDRLFHLFCQRHIVLALQV
jgi:hypothetical protein